MCLLFRFINVFCSHCSESFHDQFVNEQANVRREHDVATSFILQNPTSVITAFDANSATGYSVVFILENTSRMQSIFSLPVCFQKSVVLLWRQRNRKCAMARWVTRSAFTTAKRRRPMACLAKVHAGHRYRTCCVSFVNRSSKGLGITLSCAAAEHAALHEVHKQQNAAQRLLFVKVVINSVSLPSVE